MKPLKKLERLDKVLANNGYGTRKEVRHLVRCKVVKVNGNLVTNPDNPVDVFTDTIEINGIQVTIRQNIYLMMNKKAGYVCSSRGGMHPIVYDLLSEEYFKKFLSGDLHMVGRLDVDTEGLLILTTDGAMTHRLTSPKYHCSKKYLVYLRDAVSEKDKEIYVQKMAAGLHIEPEDNDPAADCLPAELEWADESKFTDADGNTPSAAAYLTLYEGKYHEVKRLFKACGNLVVYLKRESINNLELDHSIEIGKYRELTQDEVKALDVDQLNPHYKAPQKAEYSDNNIEEMENVDD